MSLTWAKGDPADPKANQLRAAETMRAFNLVNFPEIDTSDDTPVKWEDTVACQIQVENYAERNKVSTSQAFDEIRRGCEDRSEQNTPRSGQVYLDHGQGEA